MNPLKIDEVKIGKAGGLIGITSCPGKRDGWLDRSLAEDLDTITRWRPATILTLIDDHEFAVLGVPELGEEIRGRGFEWHHLPIVDCCAPDSRFESHWQRIGPALCDALLTGGRVLLHCRGGLGRAGSVAAMMLIQTGSSAPTAIKRVRAARSGAIQTKAQEEYVLRFSPTPRLASREDG